MSAIMGRVRGQSDARICFDVTSDAAGVKVDVYQDVISQDPEQQGTVVRVQSTLSADGAMDLAFSLLDHARRMRVAQGYGR